jgi:hypothetical protein
VTVAYRHDCVERLQCQYQRIVVIFIKFNLLCLEDLVDCLELVRFKHGFVCFLNDFGNYLVCGITRVRHFSFYESIEFLNRQSIINLVPQLENLIHRGTPIGHTRINLNLVRLLIDVGVGILSLLIIDELRLHISDHDLKGAVLFLQVIVLVWRRPRCCNFVDLACSALFLLFFLICRQAFI